MSFSQPFVLIGLALVAVPIIIHLWFRKKLRRIPFSTLKFLKKSEAKRLGWLRLRDIVILVARCLLIASLVLSLARPQTKKKLFGAGRRASVVLIIDNSYSMAYGENFSRAQTMAQELLNRYSPQSEFIVLPLCQTEYGRDSVSWVTRQSARALIEAIDLSYGRGDIHAALALASIANARNTREYVYIGDGQELNFRNLPAAVRNEQFYWLVTTVGSNVNITKVALKDPLSIPFNNYALEVTITNFSTKRWTGTATLDAGIYHYEEECDIKPEDNSTVVFLVPLSARRGTVRIYDDSLLYDNTYYFSKSPARALNVLVIGKSEFLQSALAPRDTAHAPFRVASAQTIGAIDIRRFNVLILNGVPEISESDRLKIDNFLQQPERSIVLFLGDTISTTLHSFVSQFCSIEGAVRPKGYVTLEWIDYAHPIFSVFVGSTALKTVKVFRYQKLDAPQGVCARITGFHPFTVVKDNVAIVATECAPWATDIMYKTAFVPFLFRLITFLTYETYEHELYVGDTISNALVVKAPTGEYRSAPVPVLLPGFYVADEETVAVNVVPEEGMMKIIGDEVAHTLGIQKVDEQHIVAGEDLATVFLFLALIALCVELVLLFV